MSTCECPIAGYCPRHKVDKNSHWHKLCQTRPDYFDTWERGTGPGQPRVPLTPEQIKMKIAATLRSCGCSKTTKQSNTEDKMRCPQLMQNNCCKVATTISEVWCKPTAEQCTACTNHLSSPQRVNSVTCALAYSEQEKQGLEPDPKLLDCVNNDRLETNVELSKAGRRAWEELHSFNPTIWNEKLVLHWIMDIWAIRIPDFGCGCRQEFDDYVKKNPITATTKNEYRLWTFKFHNHIREKLFQSTCTLNEACDIWNWDVMKLLIL